MRTARVLLVVATILISASPVIAAIPPEQRAALEALYNSTGGVSWTNNTNWLLPGVDECTWYGVTCDWTHSTVVDLYLPYNNLNGPLPPALQNLRDVTRLVLMGNNLTGPIPPELGSLAALERIYLSTNALTGPIPSTFGNLHALVDFQAGQNQLTGPLPPSLGSLPAVQYIWLDHNDITGEIPPELGNLSTLLYLSISYNALTGPIPPELGQLTALETLGLEGNDLTGMIPVELASLANLEALTLGGNQLTGPVPPQLGSLAKLTYLFLAGNELSGTIPPELGNLTSLTNLSLAGNALTGAIPPELANLSTLQALELGGNQLTGNVPSALANLSALATLMLGDNQLDGTIPPEIGNLTGLQMLDLSQNELSGPIPPALGSLTALTWLNLRLNHLDGTLPPALGNLTALQTIDLSFNRFSGSIPAEVGNLKNLQYLGIGSNALTGEIPAEIMGATSIVSINLDYNALRATDPVVSAWVDARSPGWLATQTAAPSAMSATIVCHEDLEISWSDGYAVTRYEVWIDDGSGFALAGTTTARAFRATGLTPATEYRFIVKSISEPWAYNENLLESEFSAPFTATTGVVARFAAVTIPEGSSGPLARTFSVTLEPPPAIPTTIEWTTYGGNASADDYVSSTGVVTFAPGETVKTFEVTVNGDAIDEPDEMFQIGIQTATGVCMYMPAMVIIADDDSPPAITVGNVTVAEGTDSWNYAYVPVTLSSPSGYTLDITWSAIAQNATENDDYIVYPDTFQLFPGQTSATLTVIVVPDSIDEPDETLEISVSGANLILPGSNAVVTITDDDDPPNLRNYDIWIGEDDAGTAQSSATFTLDNVSGWTASVEWTLVGMTATAGADFDAASGILTFAPGETWKQIAIPVLDDTIDEDLETFKLVFSNAAHLAVPAELQGTIADDDMPPTPAVNPASVVEGDVGTSARTLNITLNHPSSQTLTVNWSTSALGAVPGQDYISAAGIVTFLPGETEKPITIEVIGDTLYEWDEGFSVSMSGNNLFPATTYMVIANDDAKPNLSIVDARFSEGNAGTKTEYVWVTLDAPSGRPIEFEWSTSPGTANPGFDYIPTSGSGFFPNGTTASIVNVEIVGDTVDDYGEVFYVRVTASDESTIADGVAEILIIDDDAAPRVPDPVIRVTGCTEVDAPCEVAALSATQFDRSDWSYVWSVDGVARATGETFAPGFTMAGTYNVTLAATNAQGSGEAAVTLLLAESSGPCPEGQLCMLSKRFRATLTARDQRSDRTASGVPIRQNDLFGYFALPALTGSEGNPEVFMKIIDGRAVNDEFWVFYGGLTDLEYRLSVTDTVTGEVREYAKPAGSTAGGFDTGGGVVPETCSGEVDGLALPAVVPSSCNGGVGGLCLANAQFLVQLDARDQRSGRTGTGVAMPQGDVFGYFALPSLTNNGANPEVFVKIVDGRVVNGSFWLFFSGLTDMEYTLTVTNTLTGERKSYTKAAGSACGAYDTNAF